MSLKAAVKVSRRIAEIGREGWDACAGNPDYAANPFVSFDFLDIVEESGCAVERMGWGPQHLSVDDEDGKVAAVMPLYLKSHSQGEYIFDHSWAEAYERAGGQYYPKLISAAPFTPATGPRLLVRPDVDVETARKTLLTGAVTLCERYGSSGVHINFPTDDEWTWLGGQGLSMREGQQYHWENAGYADFDAFLAALSSGRRKTIRRERREAQGAVEILPLTGADITEEHWDAFYGFYMDTGSRKWGRPYLNRLFFSLLGERMADRVLLLMARRNGRWVAGALNLIGGDCLYGRNWGCVEDIAFLHFELCYYQAIEWAIGRGLARVEAGAQGQHKIARGYLPSPVRSAHFIADPMLRGPVEDFVAREREAVEGEMEWLAEEFSPFRQEPDQ
ncbi:MAG: GNAT family N-acetyltransferase [Phenylobacterium sp.]|uniref:GNAT family N-acetyltransferase n=1 Tax=Phenylobacterium sp. TaxID=1871053 RepID=UPI002721DD07|nr:GNAT family N-acetyltransferase [Phenylobacterium sp.]MDO8912397.1 GNAT family N-acetyltransferase [Phenylobacterium sp.]MDP3099778.1 GNAT family N-acetyltransferase [Phenylobacterium sp.]MDP3868738.1 GNAT family N-acetyltransferase [Phenylobacterium sp.]